jgi:coenzyme PQQ synthesis protein D (PqqD)
MDERSARRFACVPDVVWKDVDGDVVLVHLQTNRIYELNRTGARLWALLNEGKSVDEAEKILTEEFAVDEETAHTETTALLEDLLRQQLVEEL